ncbi:MAG: hypothetical protein LCH38_10010 [Proteobacteria bacterium]|nr:hypothetical protein [Pseudomonadota bacterium]
MTPPAAPPPVAPQQAAPAPKAPEGPSKLEQLGFLYVVAATAHLCELDISDDEDERLQKAVDAAEAASGENEQVHDLMWNKIVADISRDKKKACSDYSTESIAAIRALKD